MERPECKDCVQGIFGCNYSHNSAACLCSSKPWREEPKAKLLDFFDRMEQWYRDSFQMRLDRINKLREMVEKECKE